MKDKHFVIIMKRPHKDVLNGFGEKKEENTNREYTVDNHVWVVLAVSH